jgi:hypothetical protein
MGNGSQNEFIVGASWTTKSKPTELQDALQVCEPHLCAHVATSRLSVPANDRATIRAFAWMSRGSVMGLLDSTGV